MSARRRVLDEIESHLAFRNIIDLVLSIITLILYGLFFAVYFVNSAEPTVGGLSVTYFYGLIVWALLIIVVFIAAKISWR